MSNETLREILDICQHSDFHGYAAALGRIECIAETALTHHRAERQPAGVTHEVDANPTDTPLTACYFEHHVAPPGTQLFLDPQPAAQVPEGLIYLLQQAASVIADNADDWDARVIHLAIQDSLANFPTVTESSLESRLPEWFPDAMLEGFHDNFAEGWNDCRRVILSSAPTMTSVQSSIPRAVQEQLDGLAIFSGQCESESTRDFITAALERIDAANAAPSIAEEREWPTALEEEPPEGVELLVYFAEEGPWIARWNMTLQRFCVAQPSDVGQLPAGAKWQKINPPGLRRPEPPGEER